MVRIFWMCWGAAAAVFWLGTVHSLGTAVQAAILTLLPTAALVLLQRRRPR